MITEIQITVYLEQLKIKHEGEGREILLLHNLNRNIILLLKSEIINSIVSVCICACVYLIS